AGGRRTRRGFGLVSDCRSCVSAAGSIESPRCANYKSRTEAAVVVDLSDLVAFARRSLSEPRRFCCLCDRDTTGRRVSDRLSVTLPEKILRRRLVCRPLR